MESAVILELVNSALLVLLLYVYGKNYLKMRSPFIFGLVIFAGFLLLQNLVALYFHFMMVDYYSKEVMQHAFYVTLAQTIALAVLNYVTWKD